MLHTPRGLGRRFALGNRGPHDLQLSLGIINRMKRPSYLRSNVVPGRNGWLVLIPACRDIRVRAMKGRKRFLAGGQGGGVDPLAGPKIVDQRCEISDAARAAN